MLAKASCKNAQAIKIDFLNVDPSDPQYANATHMSVTVVLDGPFAYLVQSARPVLQRFWHHQQTRPSS
jgi:hypothetical protein